MKSVVALGNFDGVHIGHAAVLARTAAVAEQQKCTPVVYSFTSHPQCFFGDKNLKLLTSLAEKQQQIASLGIKSQIYDEFALVAHLSAEEFVQKILVDKLRAAAVVTGPDYFFGAGKSGNAEMLRKLGETYGFAVHTVPFALVQGQKVSSSRLREVIASGDVTTAAALLGRPYCLCGRVVSGKGLARKWGTPTVNISLDPSKVCPRYGVYAVELLLGDTLWQGVCNVGVRPSFDDGETPNMEVHVLDGTPDETAQATVRFLQFLRAEQTFSPERLCLQIQKDCESARHFFEERSNV